MRAIKEDAPLLKITEADRRDARRQAGRLRYPADEVDMLKEELALPTEDTEAPKPQDVCPDFVEEESPF